MHGPLFHSNGTREFQLFCFLMQTGQAPELATVWTLRAWNGKHPTGGGVLQISQRNTRGCPKYGDRHGRRFRQLGKLRSGPVPYREQQSESLALWTCQFFRSRRWTRSQWWNRAPCERRADPAAAVRLEFLRLSFWEREGLSVALRLRSAGMARAEGREFLNWPSFSLNWKLRSLFRTLRKLDSKSGTS